MKYPWIKEVIKEVEVEKIVYTPIHEALFGFKENPPTPERLKSWKSERTTKYLIAIFKSEIEDIKDNWAAAYYTGESVDHTAQRNAEAIGRVLQLRETIDTLESLGEEESEENQQEE